ncbi:MAG: acyl-CoA carboxylase epsilon subunit [Candidatus Nanopelagicales bacterium]
MAQSGPPAPLLRVVRGDPTDEEIAALVCVVAAVRSSTPSPVASASNWAASARRSFEPATWGSWRTSALPR